MAVDSILKTSALRKGCDNLTAVMIAFDNFESLISKHPISRREDSYQEEAI
jgi:hypothetical protein